MHDEVLDLRDKKARVHSCGRGTGSKSSKLYLMKIALVVIGLLLRVR